jgi:hypothetical protein
VAQFFRTPSELGSWIRDKDTLGEAFNDLMRVIRISSNDQVDQDELDIKDACTAVFNEDSENASEVLYKILSKHNLTEVKRDLKKGNDMEKKAQSRQRNDWLEGDRNKWNRTVDGFKEDTPWRRDRNQFFDFTHYTTDAISFDENPNRVYSGEALWRMYVMDKFYREYKTDEGKWVGGYINDRFHVFPDAGTPGNPDAPRDGGNQMELGLAERTRKPRTHQYSIERRMEEARGNKTYDLEVTASSNKKFNKVVKTSGKVPVSRHDDRVYSMFTDCIDMKEAGISYDDILEKVSSHYDASITGVAEIAKFANKMVKRHESIAYSFDVSKKTVTAQGAQSFKTVNDLQGTTIDPASNTQVPVNILPGTVLVRTSPNTYEISSGQGQGQQVQIDADVSESVQSLDDQEGNIQEAADELGLNEVGDEIDAEVEVQEEVADFDINEV